MVGEKAKQFHGFQRDIESISEFIRLWTTRNRRWTSPKFLIGESYGTTRGAGVAAHLQERHGLFLNGADAGLRRARLPAARVRRRQRRCRTSASCRPTPRPPGTTAGSRPTCRPTCAPRFAEVERFAVERVRRRAGQGRAAADDERAQIIQQLARYTGLSEEYIDRTDLRIVDQRFFKELLRDERRTVGRLDSRFTRHRPRRGRRDAEDDASFGASMAPFAATFNDYVRGDLGFETDRTYEILHPDLWKTWSYADHENRYVNVGELLRKTVSGNPACRCSSRAATTTWRRRTSPPTS